MTRCQRCCIPDTRPDTHFENGVCSACLTAERRPRLDEETGRAALVRLLEQHGNKGGFDCIVPSSGGKDSHWQVLELIRLGARPLVVTATTCHLTPIGRQNIDNLSRFATTIEISPNKITRAKLNRLGLSMVGDISWPEHVSIFTIPFKVSAQMGIPLVFYGENPQAQYGGPPGTEEERAMTRRWVSEFGGFLGLRPTDLIGIDGITEADMQDYTIEPEQAAKVEAYFLGQFLPWDSHRNAEVAICNGMRAMRPCQANWWDWENLDNAQTGIHDHMMYRKYGYGRLAAQVSVDVRTGRMSLDKAMHLVRTWDGHRLGNYAGVQWADILQRIGLTERELHDLMNRFTNWNIFRKTGNPYPILKEECLV